MVRTTNGFDIAEADLKLRGPGDIEGTAQSGLLNLRIADLAKDGKILAFARNTASDILDADPTLEKPEHEVLKNYLDVLSNQQRIWGRIS